MEPVEVPIGECRCPTFAVNGPGDTRTEGYRPHEQDIVYLRPKPDLEMGLASRSAIQQSGNLVGDTEAALYSVFIRYGVIAWNIVDEKSRPVPVNHSSILDRLGWAEGGAIVALRAMALYQDAVLAPLAEARSASQRPSLINGSTSASPASGLSTPSSRKRSSHSPPAAGQ